MWRRKKNRTHTINLDNPSLGDLQIAARLLGVRLEVRPVRRSPYAGKVWIPGRGWTGPYDGDSDE